MNIVAYKIKRNIIPFFIALVLLTGMCCAWYFLHPSSPYHKRITFVVGFEKVGTLVPGNRVSVRGITCGEILKVQLTDEAVYVTARVLATTQIPKNSQFRLITAGLMGERELSVLSGDSKEYVAHGDTVAGFYDEGTAGITKGLRGIMASLNTIKSDLKDVDTSVVKPLGEQLDRVSDKAVKLASTTKKRINTWMKKLDDVFDSFEVALTSLKGEVSEVTLKSTELADKSTLILPRIEALLEKTKSMRAFAYEIVAKMNSDDNSVGLIKSEKSKLAEELDQTAKDLDALMEDLKKEGLKLNVDIF